jgi:hypothetical protein
MALQVKFTLERTLWDESGVKQSPPRIMTKTFTPDAVERKTVDLAATTATVLYLPTQSSERLASFNYFLIHNTDTAATVSVEFTCNDADPAEVADIKTLSPGCWILIMSNVSNYDIVSGGSGDGFAGTADVIDQIRVKASAACKIYYECGK